jgi:hypothetical protein
MKIDSSKNALIIVTVLAAIYLYSCKHGCGKTGPSSTAGGTESHNMGANCLNCHSGTGGGEGCFEVGGTAYHEDLQSAYGSCTIDLYTDTQGTGEVVATIVSDGKGNLYTGKNINWGKGLYPAITSPNGNRKFMLEPISSGACNNCHGNTTDRIFVN